MKRRGCRLNIEAALEIYYSMPEIGNAEIAEIFGFSDKSTLSIRQKKLQVKKFMAENDIKTWNPSSVKTKTAFEVWGIDVSELEKSLKGLNRIRNLKSS